MKKKKVVLILAISAVLVFIGFRLISYLNYRRDVAQDIYLENHYIFDKNFKTEKNKTNSSKNKYLSHGMATAEAINLFRFLEQRFAEQSLDKLNDHFNNVRQYLYSRFKQEDAQTLFEIYQKYLRCQIEITNSNKYRLTTQNPKHLLRLLYMAQNFRRNKMGKENADTLFGKELKENEYLLRRAIVIGDITLLGKEKENRLQKPNP